MYTFVESVFYLLISINVPFFIIFIFIFYNIKKNKSSISLTKAFYNILGAGFNIYGKYHIGISTFLFTLVYIYYKSPSVNNFFRPIFFLILKIPLQMRGTIIGVLLTFFFTITTNYYFNNQKNKYLAKSAARLIEEDLSQIMIDSFTIPLEKNYGQKNYRPTHKLIFLTNWEALLQQLSNSLSDKHIRKIYGIYTQVEKHNEFLKIDEAKITKNIKIQSDIKLNDAFLTNQRGNYNELSFGELSSDLNSIALTGRLGSFNLRNLYQNIKYIHYRKKYSNKIEGFVKNYIIDNNIPKIKSSELDKIVAKSEEFQDLFTNKLNYPSSFFTDVLIDSKIIDIIWDDVSLKKIHDNT